MKRSTLSKLALTLVAAFVFVGANAQDDPANYSLIASDAVTANTSYVTLDKTIPFYVTPDPTYHPTWTAFSNNLTAGFVWNFYADVSWTIGTELSLAITNNYVEITANKVGTYPINVKEQAPAAYGGCEDGTGVDFNVVVLPKPSALLTGGTNTPANNWSETTPSFDFYACGSKAAETINLSITEAGVPAALQLYAYAVKKRVVILDVNGNEQAASEVVTYPIDHTIAAKGYTTSVATGALDVLTYDWDGVGPNPATPARTLYEFTLVKATDAPGVMTEGIISAVSQKSDYLALLATPTAYTSYSFGATTVVKYLVNPTPVTGPVYHIANDWAI